MRPNSLHALANLLMSRCRASSACDVQGGVICKQHLPDQYSPHFSRCSKTGEVVKFAVASGVEVDAIV